MFITVLDLQKGKWLKLFSAVSVRVKHCTKTGETFDAIASVKRVKATDTVLMYRSNTPVHNL